MIYLLFSLLIAAGHAKKGDVNAVNGVSALPLTPLLAKTSEDNAAKCRTQCLTNNDCIEATFVKGECSLFHNVVLTRGAINGAVYYKKDRGQPITDCVGQELYDDMCISAANNVETCADWIGDGTCDHGFTLSDSFHQIFLNCQKYSFDGGDCNDNKGAVDADQCFSDMDDDIDDNCKVPQDGVMEDCWGQVLEDKDCVVAALGITKCSQWLKDGSCDGGQTVSDSGVVINFSCEKFNYDEGDCKPPIAETPTPTPPPTPQPTETPTKSPTPPPTPSPTEAPTRAPTKSPVTDPTKEPTKSPSPSPTDAPEKPPTKEPTPAPTPTPPPIEPNPTESPTKSPATSPTPSPIPGVTDAPTESPVEPTPAPTNTGLTPAPSEHPSGGKYVEDGQCVVVVSNAKDLKDAEDKRAAEALANEYYEIAPRVWDDSANLLCDPNKPMYQSKVAGKPNLGGDNKNPMNAVLCHGNSIVAPNGKLVLAWNTGEGAKLYGKFDTGCDTVIWNQVDAGACKDECGNDQCDQEARAIQLVPCGKKPDGPTPEPTTPPTTTAQMCQAVTDKASCKANPVCYWESGKCDLPPTCDTWNDTNTKTCEALKDQDGNKICRWDKDSGLCEKKPTPSPTPEADPCSGFGKKDCKKQSGCEYVADTCQVKATPAPTEIDPTPAPTKMPTAGDVCVAIKEQSKCKDGCEWDKKKDPKCQDKCAKITEQNKCKGDCEWDKDKCIIAPDCTTYKAYVERITAAVKNKKASKSSKDCAKYGGKYESKKCIPYPYDKEEKGGKTAKFKCKKIKDEESCGCLKNKCKMKVKKRRGRTKVKCKGSQQFKYDIHGGP